MRENDILQCPFHGRYVYLLGRMILQVYLACSFSTTPDYRTLIPALKAMILWFSFSFSLQSPLHHRPQEPSILPDFGMSYEEAHALMFSRKTERRKSKPKQAEHVSLCFLAEKVSGGVDTWP